MTIYPKKINGVRAAKLPVGTQVLDVEGNIWECFESYRSEPQSGIDVNGEYIIGNSIVGHSYRRVYANKNDWRRNEN